MELPRVYLNAAKLSNDALVLEKSQDEIDAKVNERTLLGQKNRFATLIPVHEIELQAIKNAMIECVIDRLDFGNKAGNAYCQILYNSPNKDVEGNPIQNALLDNIPPEVRPIYMEKTAEYLSNIGADVIINRLDAARQELQNSTTLAEKHHAMAEIAVNAFQPIPDGFRLKKAGRKLILQTAAKKVRKRLVGKKSELTQLKNENLPTLFGDSAVIDAVICSSPIMKLTSPSQLKHDESFKISFATRTEMG
jgi:hypothetical protein